MKKYVAPVLDFTGAAEGVYMASGGEAADCWSGEAVSVQDWTGSDHVFEIRLVHSTAVQHISTGVTVTLSFNNTVENAYSENDWTCTVSGNTVTVHRINHANGYNSGDHVSFKVWARAADEATSKGLSARVVGLKCDKATNVQGGGADGN